MLQDTTAAHSEMRARRRHAIGARDLDSNHLRVVEVPVPLDSLRTHGFAGKRIGNEHRLAVDPCDSTPVMTKGDYLDGDFRFRCTLRATPHHDRNTRMHVPTLDGGADRDMAGREFSQPRPARSRGCAVAQILAARLVAPCETGPMPDRPLASSNLYAIVVEDDAVTREFLVGALELAGWDAVAACNMSIALGTIRARTPRLVLCDVRLPDGDAFEFAGELALDTGAGTRELYAVALSADVDRSLRARLIGAGYDDVLPKPLSLCRLMAALPDARARRWSAAHPERSSLSRDVLAVPTTAGNGRAAILDDDAALEVCGDWSTVQALRRLLADELPGHIQSLEEADAEGDGLAVDEILHRLRSAGGFCGAAALILAVSEAGTHEIEVKVRDRRLARVLLEGRALLEHLASRRAQQQLGGT